MLKLRIGASADRSKRATGTPMLPAIAIPYLTESVASSGATCMASCTGKGAAGGSSQSSLETVEELAILARECMQADRSGGVHARWQAAVYWTA